MFIYVKKLKVNTEWHRSYNKFKIKMIILHNYHDYCLYKISGTRMFYK